jgi:hypothetical protein
MSDNKNIKELSEDEAKEILKFVYPNDEYNWFKKLSFEPVITENGKQQITFGGRSIIGIEFHNGQDNCILHFDNTKAVLWFYKNGYDITELLEANSYLSQMEKDFENFAFAIEWMSKGEEGFKDGFKQNWTLEYVTKKCRELLDKYYYKDYE